MISIPETTSISRIADWIELSVLIENDTYSKSKIISLVRGGGGDLDEQVIDSAFSELLRRLNLYGAYLPPFSLNRKVIAPNIDWKMYPEYILCLIFSLFGVEDTTDGGTKLFERISNDILKFYLHGEAITFGFPNTMNLTTQIENIAKACFEIKGGREPAATDKDRGVDVIGWKPFNDGRNSQIIVLLQCAAGGNWRTKKPVPLPAWATYISWNHIMTIPGLSITQILEDNKWNNAVFDYGLMIDRVRIYKILTDPDFAFNVVLRDEVEQWCTDKIL